MIDALIRRAAQLGMGENAQRFIGLLADSIFSGETGGFAGFRRRFEQAGLGDKLQSWIGTQPGENALQPDQFNAGFGAGPVGRIVQQLGVVPAAVNKAGAEVLPNLVGLITSGGYVPTAMPSGLSALLRHGAAPRKRRWLGWLFAALAIVLLVLLLRNCHSAKPATDAVTTVSTPIAQETAPEPAATLPPQFHFANADGRVTVDGRLATDADKSRLWDALKAQFGADKVAGDIVIDPQTAPAGWLDKLIAALPQLKASGLKFGFDGDKLSMDTSGLPEAQRFDISQQLRSLFGGYSITGLWDRATAALSGLKAGYSAQDLVKALNLMTVYFDTGSNAVTADSMEVLQRAADAIKAAPAGTRIEIGGHTDNTGTAEVNLDVSQKRADAVVARLVELGVDANAFSAKGYGQDKPVADNGTDEGRAKNRRIEFTVLK